jgi:transcriptional regulator with XRE-family HTH domain
VQVMGKGPRTCCTFTEIANGIGMSVSIVSLILRGKRPISEYAKRRLAAFFGVSAGESFTINVCTPPPRPPRGRLVGRIRPGSPYPGPPALDSYAASQTVGPQESEEEWDNWLRARLPGEK